MDLFEGSSLAFRESTNVRPPTQNPSRNRLHTVLCIRSISSRYSHPFYNLGTVVPELLWRDRSGCNSKVLGMNAHQARAYLDIYSENRNSPSGSVFDGIWGALEATWARFHHGGERLEERAEAAVYYTVIILALETCQSLWARFNHVRMMGG